jgi:hypothetical protein
LNDNFKIVKQATTAFELFSRRWLTIQHSTQLTNDKEQQIEISLFLNLKG